MAKKTTRKKAVVKKKQTKFKAEIPREVIIPEEVKEKRVGQELTITDREKGSEMSASIRTMMAKIKEVMADGKIDNLQMVTLENWARMLTSDNDSERAYATMNVSRYLFAPKKEVISVPVININCTFVGIKDVKK
jgi:hypothetical protein